MTNFFVASQSKLLKCFGFLILMFVFSIQSNAQTTVTGTVSDANGPIPGANVNVKGTKTGVSTSFDGTYSISVPSNGVLIFSFLGFTSREVGVNGQKTINVKLEEDSNNLKEVVVIGYGAQRKEAVTGSVASIKGSEIREVPSANITQSMQGRLPGFK
ncbi:carboxypeptidase-like regulatory domain-containing protein [Flavobacterium ginsengisoli]|uniref:carboxypeptidase-like regulatory domain-containing protein n=1 Tax=Flavobacterium ginsengisoli TaxID=871694 RepID=UPI0024156FB3|nr:carboxypeptidase-like regulatory domain-containing protein [Flavobacterium ginsengisoli]